MATPGRFIVSFLSLLIGLAVPSFSPVSGGLAASNNDWREGYSLIIMNHTQMASARETRDYIESQGGKIALLASPHVMTGWLPTGLSAKLKGGHGIDLIAQSSIGPEAVPYRDHRTTAAVSFYNNAISNRAKSRVSAAAETPGEPLINDVFQRPVLDYESYAKNVQRADAVPAPGNSDSMTGTVAVNFFFVESDGSVDPDTYTWTETDQQATINKALSGLSWWSDQASRNGVSLTFVPFYYLSDSPVCLQGYEPIRHSIADDHLWIDRIMENLGFSSGNTFDRVISFNTWSRQSSATDWSFSVFVAYNPSPASTKFAGSQYFTYSFYGGPYVQTLFIPDGWGQENFDRVLAHETGHIFWACDEYYQAGYGGCMTCGPCVEGPRSVNNGNCEYCNAAATACMMRDCSLALCTYTRQQIGWPMGGRLSVVPTDTVVVSGQKGGAFSPKSITYTVSNVGDATLKWTVSKVQPWIGLSATEGSLSPGSSTDVVATITSEADALSPGSYRDTLAFTNASNGEGNTRRSVVLTVAQESSGSSSDSGGSGGSPGTGGGGSGGGGGCFIATVAFGRAEVEEVCILRHFRDDFLTTNQIGRKIVGIYYRYSPAVAARIKDSPMICAVVRAVLEPFVFIIKWGQKIIGKDERRVYINGCERRGAIQRGGRMATTSLH